MARMNLSSIIIQETGHQQLSTPARGIEPTFCWQKKWLEQADDGVFGKPKGVDSDPLRTLCYESCTGCCRSLFDLAVAGDCEATA